MWGIFKTRFHNSIKFQKKGRIGHGRISHIGSALSISLIAMFLATKISSKCSKYYFSIICAIIHSIIFGLMKKTASEILFTMHRYFPRWRPFDLVRPENWTGKNSDFFFFESAMRPTYLKLIAMILTSN